MPTEADKRHEMELALRSVINTLLDGQKGFADIGEHLKDETLKRYFLAESLKRAQFRGDLEEVLHQNGVHDINESGSVAGTLHRAWGDLKAKLGGGDHALLTTALRGRVESRAATSGSSAIGGSASSHSQRARLRQIPPRCYSVELANSRCGGDKTLRKKRPGSRSQTDTSGLLRARNSTT